MTHRIQRLASGWKNIRRWPLWGHLLSLVLVIAVLRLGLEWSWGWIFYLTVGLIAAKQIVDGLANDAVNRFWERWISPGVGGQRSIVFPRVWELQLTWTKNFMEHLRTRPSVRPEEEPLVADGLWKATSTNAFLMKLKVEEYATRIRIHRWVAPFDATDTARSAYDWWDLAHGHLWADSGESSVRKASRFWSYSTDTMHGVVHLSGFWQPDRQRKQTFLKLVLWFDPGGSLLDDAVAKGDILFEIPLDPGLLDDERGSPLYVAGRKRRASEVLPYPEDEGRWEHRSGEGDEWQWSWYLTMQTFDKGSYF